MANSITQIRSDIASTKEQISQTVSELEDRLQELRDIKSTVRRYPLPSFLVSFGVGFMLSGALKKTVLLGARKSMGHVVTAALTGLVTQMVQENVMGKHQERQGNHRR